MQITRGQLRKLIKEITGDIIHDPVDAARHQTDYKMNPTDRKFFVAISEVIGSFIPGVGQVIAAKDLTLALRQVFLSGGADGKINTAVSALAFVPGLKVAIKAGYKLFKAGQKNVKMSDKEASEKAAAITAELMKSHPDKIS